MATSMTQSYALLQTSLALMGLRVNGSEAQKNIHGLAALESSRAARYALFWVNIVNDAAMHSNQSKPIVACRHAHVTRTEVEESQLLPLLSVLLTGFGKRSHK